MVQAFEFYIVLWLKNIENGFYGTKSFCLKYTIYIKVEPGSHYAHNYV